MLEKVGNIQAVAKTFPISDKIKEKTIKQRTHKGIWLSVCLGRVPWAIWGQVPDIRDVPTRVSAGQTEHFHGTNRTVTRDGCGPEVGVSHRISLFTVFSSRFKVATL